MPKVRKHTEKADAGTWPARWRVLVSALLLLHLVGLVVGPASADPSSPLAGRMFRHMRWYAEPMFLNHGYRFFAPNPGPSYLVRYEVDLPSGETIEGVMPNLKTQWPRVLYHRHFMLTSRLQNGPQDRFVQVYATSYARHLFNRYEAKQVRLWLVRHNLPDPPDVLQGKKLADREFYEEFRLTTFPPQDEEVPLPSQVPESLRPDSAPELVPAPNRDPGSSKPPKAPEEVPPRASVLPAGPLPEAPR